MKKLYFLFLACLLGSIAYGQNTDENIPKTIEELRAEIRQVKKSCDDIINRHKEAGILWEEAKRNIVIGSIIGGAGTLMVLSSDDLSSNFFAGDNSGTMLFYGFVAIDIFLQISAQIKINTMIRKLLYE